jgi:tripartite-type tricarboxylate transporter receptor subunit TctC
VSTSKRVADLPDVPTPFEAGYKDADSAIWFGIFMPSKTSRDVVEKFHAAGIKVLATPAMQEGLKRLGVEPWPLTTKEMDELVGRELVANAQLVKAAGIK